MTDGLATGWHHAVWTLGYLIGLLPVLAAVALLIALAVAIGPRITHRVRVHRLRAQQHRTGRQPARNQGDY